eukprot:m.191343 g.191343  ORF g.191343 m.191343 type:complete len:280 (+) comp39447_c2_seq9:184-1023(+)
MLACQVLILFFAVCTTSSLEVQTRVQLVALRKRRAFAFIYTLQKPFSCSGCGVAGLPGLPGNNGVSGSNGVPGHNGIPGRDGREGQRGSPGIKGDKGDTGKGIQGIQGPQGKPGQMGDMGEKGQQGELGVKGEKGTNSLNNWKHCAWKKVEKKDSGLVYDCTFTKKDGSSSLKVSYAATARVLCPGKRCCGRWFFTFNGRECSSPMPIDGVVYVNDLKNNWLDPLRARVIEGVCEKLPAGSITVAVHVGNCDTYGTSDRDSGWNSVSSIMIEEYPPPQK